MATKVRSKKLFLGVKDDRFESRRQSSVISILTDGDELFLNQYAKMFTEDEIGSFDIVKVNNQAVLEFTPLDGRINEYNYNFISYDTKQDILTFDSYDFGNTVSIATTHTNIGIKSEKSLYRIPSDFSSSKILVEFSSNSDDTYEYNEINIVTNGTNTSFSEFGRITISENELLNQIGIGTYNVIDTGNGLELVFYSDHANSLDCNVVSVSIANTEFSAVNSRGLRYADVRSVTTGIGSTSSPSPVAITSYTSDYNLGYFIVQVTDTTNDKIQLSELLVLNNEVDSSIIQYGDVYTDNELGSFDSNTSSLTELIFTPNEDIDVEITFLQHILSYVEFSSFPVSIDFNNAELSTGISKFDSSSEFAFKKDFNLTHKDIPIFERRFNGSLQSTPTNPASVDIDRNLIYIPNHFFRTGELINYRSSSFEYIEVLSSTLSSTAGVGTDKLDIVSSSGLKVNDFLNINSGYNQIVSINSNSVSLASTISSQILVGSAVTFSRLFESDSEQNSTVSSIGISQTYISGVGVTDKLSGNLYAYTLDAKYIGFCTSPNDALSETPKLIDLTSVGIGNDHYITSTNPNSKCIILIDNIIQSPVVSTAITSTLLDDVGLIDSTLYFSGITSFFSGNLIKINDEVMKITSVGVGSTNFVEVERPLLGSAVSTHPINSTITKMKGNYNIIGSKIYFADAPYGPIYDDVNGDVNIRSTFQGRVFLRSGIPDSNESVYEKNYIFDDISGDFDSVSKTYTIKSNEENISGFSTSNSIILINNIFQSPQNDYDLLEISSETKLNFTGTGVSALYDANNASVPRGGIIVSVGSSNGYGYQPLVSAGGTAIVSIAGTIQSISIGNSGSGYRPGVQSIVRVGVQTLSTGTPNIEFIGTAVVSNGSIVSVAITNPGSGYATTNPPYVVFDDPLSYSNLDLIHTSSSSGIGSQAKIDIVVGQGSSVIDFTIKNYGYSYNIGDTLTFAYGGISGIPTDTSKIFDPFTLNVINTYTDNFSGWSIGELQKLDDIDNLFNGTRKTFPISDNGNRFSILSKDGSEIDLESILLIFINDILQEPSVSYTFNGGSTIEFTEAPKSGDKCRILFYKGTPNIDVVDVDILETVKTGDTLKIVGEEFNLIEKNRLVRDIILPDVVETSTYNSIGITSNLELQRSVVWCRQRNDTIVDGIPVNKSRIRYEPSIFPVSNIIESVSLGSTIIFVDFLKTGFDAINENRDSDYINKIEIIDNSNLIQAIATATVSIGGTIESVTVIEGGVGYSTSPEISIQNPSGIGPTGKATLSSNLIGNYVDSIIVESPGFGYTFKNPPLVFVEPPSITSEYISGVSYSGDFGIISGIKTASVGFASTALILDLYIPENSYLRNSLATNPIITQSSLEENYYFKISNSKIGNGITSLRRDGSIIGIGTTGIDNIYQVISVSSASTDVFGVGNDTVLQVTVSLSDYNGITGIGYSEYFGDYSWGLINVSGTKNAYSVNENYGVVGLNSTPIVRRYNRLGYNNYDNL